MRIMKKKNMYDAIDRWDACNGASKGALKCSSGAIPHLKFNFMHKNAFSF